MPWISSTSGIFKSNYGATLWLPSTGVPNGNYLSAGYGVANYCGSTTAQQPFYQVDGTVKYGPLEDETLDFLTMMHQWYTEGLIYPDFINNMAPLCNGCQCHCRRLRGHLV